MCLTPAHPACCPPHQERTNPQLLISSASRRRRIAEGSGRSEGEVSEMMTAFTQMKAQTSNMSKLMKLSQGGWDWGWLRGVWADHGVT
jgi:signal recognition particle GTPase